MAGPVVVHWKQVPRADGGTEEKLLNAGENADDAVRGGHL
jgi:hypothetical protein